MVFAKVDIKEYCRLLVFIGAENGARIGSQLAPSSGYDSKDLTLFNFIFFQNLVDAVSNLDLVLRIFQFF